MKKNNETDNREDSKKEELYICIYLPKPVNPISQDFTFIACDLTDDKYNDNKCITVPKFLDKECVGGACINDMNREEFFELEHHAKLHALGICFEEKAGCEYH